jgi:hypothetical protein
VPDGVGSYARASTLIAAWMRAKGG